MTDKRKIELANALHEAWDRYILLLGEAPHGTLPQLLALVALLKFEEQQLPPLPTPPSLTSKNVAMSEYLKIKWPVNKLQGVIRVYGPPDPIFTYTKDRLWLFEHKSKLYAVMASSSSTALAILANFLPEEQQ